MTPAKSLLVRGSARGKKLSTRPLVFWDAALCFRTAISMQARTNTPSLNL